MTTYSTLLDVDTSKSSIIKTFSAGRHILTVTFTWSDANEEQYNIVNNALVARRDADPLLDPSDNLAIDRDYDYLEFYTSLPEDLETYLAEGGKYPQSIRLLSEAQRAYKLDELRTEAVALNTLILPYKEQLVWNVSVKDSTGETHTGTVRPGGWINNQGLRWRIRFVSRMKEIGRYDLNKVYMEAEVA